MKTITLVSALLLMLVPGISMAEESQPVYPRNTDIKLTVNPLAYSVRTAWPEDIKTIGDAARYILEPAGYQLVTSHPAPPEASSIASKAVPPIAKLNRTMPIIDVLQIMIGAEKAIVIDPTHKLVSFREYN